MFSGSELKQLFNGITVRTLLMPSTAFDGENAPPYAGSTYTLLAKVGRKSATLNGKTSGTAPDATIGFYFIVFISKTRVTYT